VMRMKAVNNSTFMNDLVVVPPRGRKRKNSSSRRRLARLDFVESGV
jgi:hypothetical protein